MRYLKAFTVFFVVFILGIGIFVFSSPWIKTARAKKLCQNHLFYDVSTGLWYCMPGPGPICC